MKSTKERSERRREASTREGMTQKTQRRKSISFRVR
jgi:hypothetical protein